MENKSKIVNTALQYYFDAKSLLKKKEEEFMLNELAHYEENGESYTFAETFKDEDGNSFSSPSLQIHP